MKLLKIILACLIFLAMQACFKKDSNNYMPAKRTCTCSFQTQPYIAKDSVFVDYLVPDIVGNQSKFCVITWFNGRAPQSLDTPASGTLLKYLLLAGDTASFSGTGDPQANMYGIMLILDKNNKILFRDSSFCK